MAFVFLMHMFSSFNLIGGNTENFRNILQYLIKIGGHYTYLFDNLFVIGQ